MHRLLFVLVFLLSSLNSFCEDKLFDEIIQKSTQICVAQVERIQKSPALGLGVDHRYIWLKINTKIKGVSTDKERFVIQYPILTDVMGKLKKGDLTPYVVGKKYILFIKGKNPKSKIANKEGKLVAVTELESKWLGSLSYTATLEVMVRRILKLKHKKRNHPTKR